VPPYCDVYLYPRDDDGEIPVYRFRSGNGITPPFDQLLGKPAVIEFSSGATESCAKVWVRKCASTAASTSLVPTVSKEVFSSVWWRVQDYLRNESVIETSWLNRECY